MAKRKGKKMGETEGLMLGALVAGVAAFWLYRDVLGVPIRFPVRFGGACGSCGPDLGLPSAPDVQYRLPDTGDMLLYSHEVQAPEDKWRW